MTKDDLIAFEAEVAGAFNAGRIRAPVHLAGGNEDALIDIFKGVGPNDWIAGAWRMHYHCLLKGVPRERLMEDILLGKSITLCYPEHRIISSAIVGGILPIALGIAWSIKRAGLGERVWAFMGDMTARTGIAHECRSYAVQNGLPIVFVEEDNGISVCTDTKDAWGRETTSQFSGYYSYKLPWPHSGAGKRVEF